MKETPNGNKAKSAPCTPCTNQDDFFDMDESGRGTTKLNPRSCTGSTPKLNRYVKCTSQAGVAQKQHSLDRYQQRPAVVGCSPVELTSHLHQNYADDNHLIAHEHHRRHRRPRTRERHRSAHR